MNEIVYVIESLQYGQTAEQINEILHNEGIEQGRWVDDHNFVTKYTIVEVPAGQTREEFKEFLQDLGIEEVELND